MCAQVPLFIDAHVEKWYRFNIRQEFRIKPEADIYRGMSMLKNEKVRNAVMIGTLCSISYLGVYYARNILSVVTPQIIEGGAHTEEYIGSISSMFFTFYAVGQLINGLVGNKVKSRYMISFGLLLAGVCNALFPYMLDMPFAAHLTYGMIGFFLSMIYAPMTKVVAENTEPLYAARCCLGYTFASYLGSPVAGLAAAFLAWQAVFFSGSAALLIMGTICFLCFLYFEKVGIVKYNQYDAPKAQGQGLKVLVEHRIIKFTFVSVLTGIVRTAVVFWMPTYLTQYLGFSPQDSGLIFTVSTFVISASAFLAVFIYERLKHNMDLTLFLFFAGSACSFVGVYLVNAPMVNIVLLILAILFNNCAASMLWSIYCPSLRDTGMVSGATGYLDFMSYMAAAVSSSLFANAVTGIGWKNLILVWLLLMAAGVIVALPFGKKTNTKRPWEK